MYDPNNIIVGAASVKVGNDAEIDLGYTKGGVVVRYETEFTEVFSDQGVGVVDKSRSSERMFIVFTMSEITIANLSFYFDLGSSGSSMIVPSIANDCNSTGGKLTLIGVGPNCSTRRFTFNRCFVSKGFDYKMSRDEETLIEIEFEAMKDSNGNFGIIVDL